MCCRQTLTLQLNHGKYPLRRDPGCWFGTRGLGQILVDKLCPQYKSHHLFSVLVPPLESTWMLGAKHVPPEPSDTNLA